MWPGDQSLYEEDTLFLLFPSHGNSQCVGQMSPTRNTSQVFSGLAFAGSIPHLCSFDTTDFTEVLFSGTTHSQNGCVVQKTNWWWQMCSKSPFLEISPSVNGAVLFFKQLQTIANISYFGWAFSGQPVKFEESCTSHWCRNRFNHQTGPHPDQRQVSSS